MIGDKIFILDVHKEKGNIIFESFLKGFKTYRKKIISIAGVSGTGKTEVSLVLQELLWTKNIRAKCLHLDDYYKTNWKDRNQIRKKEGIVGKEEISWNSINKVILDFKSNQKQLLSQRIHKYLDSIEYVVNLNNNIDVLILEGLYALYSEIFDLGIYLEGSNEETYSFRKMRNKENPDDAFRKEVVKKESACVRQSKNKAKLIIPW